MRPSASTPPTTFPLQPECPSEPPLTRSSPIPSPRSLAHRDGAHVPATAATTESLHKAMPPTSLSDTTPRQVGHSVPLQEDRLPAWQRANNNNPSLSQFQFFPDRDAGGSLYYRPPTVYSVPTGREESARSNIFQLIPTSFGRDLSHQPGYLLNHQPLSWSGNYPEGFHPNLTLPFSYFAEEGIYHDPKQTVASATNVAERGSSNRPSSWHRDANPTPKPPPRHVGDFYFPQTRVKALHGAQRGARPDHFHSLTSRYSDGHISSHQDAELDAQRLRRIGDASRTHESQQRVSTDASGFKYPTQAPVGEENGEEEEPLPPYLEQLGYHEVTWRPAPTPPQRPTARQRILRTPSPPARATQQEDVNGAVLAALSALTRQLTEGGRTDRYNEPTTFFTGEDAEDPEEFLHRLGSWLRSLKIRQDQAMFYVQKTLRGDALKWFKTTCRLDMGFEMFTTLFRENFDGLNVVSLLTTKLYGATQTGEETASGFILNKVALFRRLAPATPEHVQASIIREQLLPPIRVYTRGVPVLTVQQLVDMATQIERDIVPETAPTPAPRRQTAPAPQPAPKTQPTSQARQQERCPQERKSEQQREAKQGPPYPCRYCGDDHYHNECPHRPHFEPASQRQQAPQQQQQQQQSRNQQRPQEPPRQQQRQQAPQQQRFKPGPQDSRLQEVQEVSGNAQGTEVDGRPRSQNNAQSRRQ